LEQRKERESEQRAELSSLLDTQFLATFVHELRNTLSLVSNGLFIIGRAQPGSEHAVEALDLMRRGMRRTTAMLNDVLELTRFPRGKVTLELKPLDLTALVRDAVGGLQAESQDERGSGAVGRHHVGFHDGRVELDERASEPCVTAGDPARLSRALSELVRFAARLAGKGETVSVSVRRIPGDTLPAVVALTCPAATLDQEACVHLFDPVYCVAPASQSESWTLNIGPALAKCIIGFHRGDVSVTTAANRSAEILIRLP